VQTSFELKYSSFFTSQAQYEEYTGPMKSEEFSHIVEDGKSIHVYRWSPIDAPQACVLIAHGMAEHAGRYARLAELLCSQGFEVWAPDHRGHGKTATEGELGWLAESDGFRRVVEDLRSIALQIAVERKGKPLFLLGHSWGSFLAQGFISLYGGLLAGCALSGTAGNGGLLISVAKGLSGLGAALLGEKRPSPFMDKLSFGSFNNAFKPTRTAFDWLSRDDAEVNAYIRDPYCGFVCTWGFFRDLTRGLAWIHLAAVQATIPIDLPLYMFAGDKDPVGGATGSFMALYKTYERLGLRSLSYKLYPEARHETLNEINRDEVSNDLIRWLNSQIAAL
jgi:alpha-beta hydrolase superfamily lysophospholipase